MSRRGSICLVFLALLLAACRGDVESTAVPGDGSTAYIENKGSDTIVNLALAWAESFRNNTT